MKRWLREPLLHFVLLGALIFAGYALVRRDDGLRADEIVVTQAQLAMLATTFAGTWQRPPTADEMDGLIRDYVREEVAAREAAGSVGGNDMPIIDDASPSMMVELPLGLRARVLPR